MAWELEAQHLQLMEKRGNIWKILGNYYGKYHFSLQVIHGDGDKQT
jgi:hypothetical protein